MRRWSRLVLLGLCSLVVATALTGAMYQWLATRKDLAAAPSWKQRGATMFAFVPALRHTARTSNSPQLIRQTNSIDSISMSVRARSGSTHGRHDQATTMADDERIAERQETVGRTDQLAALTRSVRPC